MTPILMFTVQFERHFYNNFIFSLLIIQGKCLAFQFLTRGIRKERPNQTWSQNEPKSAAT